MVRTLYEICDALKKELKEYAEKTRSGMSAGDLDTIDKLTHALKSVKTTIAMIEAEGEDEGYSSSWYRPMYYYDGGMGVSERMSRSPESERGYSRRGRGRDSMGRFTRGRSYAYDDGSEHVIEQMRGMLDELPDDKRREIEQVLNR